MRISICKCGGCGFGWGQLPCTPYYFCENCKRFCHTFEELQKPAGEGEYFEPYVTVEDVACEMHIGKLIGELMIKGHSLEEAERIVRKPGLRV